jgi:hypothetical protein
MLRATVMVVMMVVVVRDSSECGARERNQQQRTSKKLLHGQNVARVFPQWKERCAPNQDKQGAHVGSEPPPPGVNWFYDDKYDCFPCDEPSALLL